MPNPYVALVELVLGGGVANAPRNKWEADHAEKSYSDTDHLVDLLSAGSAAIAGGATLGALGDAGVTTVGAGAGAGAVGGLAQRAASDLLKWDASAPADYVKDALLGAALGAGMGALGTIGEGGPHARKVDAPEALDVGLSDRGVRPGPGERSTTRQQYKAQRRQERAERTAGRADQPLDPDTNRPGKSMVGHGHGDHGHQVTPQQQGDRIRTGIAPSKRPAKPVSKASSFSSADAEAEALARGRLELEKAVRGGQATPVEKNGSPGRFEAIVETKRKNGFGRNEVKAKGPDGKTLKDASGQIQTRTDPTPLRRAKVIWEYVPSAKDWRPVTYFPME